jgi:peptidoglycan-N-acetylglucosamine deacetylase
MFNQVLMGAVFFILLSLVIGPGIFLVGIPFFSRPITRVRTTRPLIALTFDDGPDPEYTPMILDILDKQDARATFFVVGKKAQEHPEIVAAIIAGGHEIANHSSVHRHLLSLSSYRSQYRDMEEAQGIIESISGISPRFYRPPMGYKIPETFIAARRLGLRVAGWTVKGWDTVVTDPDRIADHILKHARPGTIVLLHDAPTLAQVSNDRSPTVRSLPKILTGLREKGISSVTLSELIHLSGQLP